MGASNSHPVENPHITLESPKLQSSVCAGAWFQGPCVYQNLRMLKSLTDNGTEQRIQLASAYVGSQPRCQSRERRRLAVHILKKIAYKWTHVFLKGQLNYYPHLQVRRLRSSTVTYLALSHTPGEWSAGI